MSGLLASLQERRVPHALAAHLGASWLLVESSGFAEQRYGFDRVLTDSVIILMLSALPSVLVFAWNHGRKGKDEWKKSELVFFAINALAVFAALGWRLSWGEPKEKAPPIAVAVEGAAAEFDEPLVIPDFGTPVPVAERKCVLFAPPEVSRVLRESDAWLPFALEYGVTRALAIRPDVRPLGVSNSFAPELERLGIEPGAKITMPFLRELGRRTACETLVASVLERDDKGGYRLSMRVASTDAAVKSVTHDLAGADLLVVSRKTATLLHDAIGSTATSEMELVELLSDDPKVLELIARGGFAIRGEDWDGAREFFEEALALDPDCADALLSLSMVARAQNEEDKSEAYLRRAVQHAYRLPPHERWRLSYGQYALAQQPELARRVLEQQVENYPLDYDAKLTLANLMMNEGKSEEGLKLMRSILDVSPRHLRSLRLLAIHEMRAEDFELALVHATSWAEIAGTDPDPIVMIADIHKRSGDFEKARAAYQRAIVLEPGDPGHEFELIDLDGHLGLYQEAAAGIERMAKRDDPELAIRLESRRVTLHRAMGQPRAALECAQRRFDLQIVGAPPLLVTRYEQIILMQLVRAGELERATALHDKMLAASGGGPFGKALRMSSETMWFYEIRDAEQMRNAATKGLAMQKAMGQSPDAYESYLIYAFMFEDKWAQALASIDRVVAHKPSMRHKVEDERAQCLVELARFDEALVSAKALVKGEPGDADFHVLVGRAEEGLGDIAEAREAYERALKLWEFAEPRFEGKIKAKARLEALPPSRE